MRDSRRLEELEKCEYILGLPSISPFNKWVIEQYKADLIKSKEIIIDLENDRSYKVLF